MIAKQFGITRLTERERHTGCISDRAGRRVMSKGERGRGFLVRSPG